MEMRRQFRKFVGATVIVAFVPAYALIATVIAQARTLQEAPGVIQLLCYAALGLVWILPMMPLIKWMERRDLEP
jgi:Protein of unknown function (DUF2842)